VIAHREPPPRFYRALAVSKVKIPHNPAAGMSAGIGMFGVTGTDPAKLVEALQNKYAIYTALMPHEEYVGIRVTPSMYSTLAEVDYFAGAVEKELNNG
jgi:selenocysteine lyase/cysteine desulfurase